MLIAADIARGGHILPSSDVMSNVYLVGHGQAVPDNDVVDETNTTNLNSSGNNKRGDCVWQRHKRKCVTNFDIGCSRERFLGYDI